MVESKLNLPKIEKEIKEKKKWLKKKKPILYLVLCLILIYLTFFGGAFFHDSKIIQKFDLFPLLFGIRDVEMDTSFNPMVQSNNTLIPFNIKNIGDKDIEELTVLYSFCGQPSKIADIPKNKLYKGESIGFNVKTDIILNTSCQVYTDKVWTDVYEDPSKNCYIDVPESITKNYCNFCKVEFEVYMDKEKKQKELWYPYLGDSFYTSNYIRNVLSTTPLTINWKEGYNSTCKVLAPNSPKPNLVKKENIALTFFDAWTMCKRGDDIEWCKENFYNKWETNVK